MRPVVCLYEARRRADQDEADDPPGLRQRPLHCGLRAERPAAHYRSVLQVVCGGADAKVLFQQTDERLPDEGIEAPAGQ